MADQNRAGRWGENRVLAPEGSLPQGAQQLDPAGPCRADEVEIAVELLNIDSASFHQIIGAVGRDAAAVATHIASIVAARGKMQNPVTGSGGMLLGRVVALGEDYAGPVPLRVGDRIATLVSLTLTPLRLDAIHEVRLGSEQVVVEGRAFLPASAPLVVMPVDLPEALALSVLDVCGAPAQTARLVREGMRVAILGAGKSGTLCMAQARLALGSTGRLVAVDRSVEVLSEALAEGVIDAGDAVDAKDALGAAKRITELLGGEADVVINTANVDATEMAAILSVREGGTVYFFNMATSFARAALGAEGVGKDANLVVGNGYAVGHAELALDLVRSSAFVRRKFERALSSNP